jgi:hypothetical protein
MEGGIQIGAKVELKYFALVSYVQITNEFKPFQHCQVLNKRFQAISCCVCFFVVPPISQIAIHGISIDIDKSK